MMDKNGKVKEERKKHTGKRYNDPSRMDEDYSEDDFEDDDFEDQYDDDVDEDYADEDYIDDDYSDEVLEAKWKLMKEPFQREYSHLTHSDLSYRQGAFGEMLGRIGQRTGLSRSELRNRIFDWDESGF